MNMFATYTRKALLATAGIALTAGLAGPTSAALATEPTTQTVAVAQTVAQAAADTPDKPTVEQLMPAGVPDNQSSFTPNAE
ncbi:hypothetical protein, partial [Polymorphospora rubra]|uniref:hypothetical protein n=1 Tax=Polymorphospora rubra TaxID=338584 RepID=UPI0034038A0D